jgi:RTA1 like protein
MMLTHSFLTTYRYLTSLTIGPTFISASIYLTLARIIPTYSSTLSRFQPRTYTILFIALDVIALLLQAVGGAIASITNDENTGKLGINIMLAGVSWQVSSMGIFSMLCAEFIWRLMRASEESLSRVAGFVELRHTLRFRIFLWGLGLATLTIFVRSVFRCVELREGFRGKLANQEVTFMILGGAMIVIAVAMLTICHPGPAFRGRWQEAGWSLRADRLDERKVVVQRSKGPDRTKSGAPEKSPINSTRGEPPRRPYRP